MTKLLLAILHALLIIHHDLCYANKKLTFVGYESLVSWRVKEINKLTADAVDEVKGGSDDD